MSPKLHRVTIAILAAFGATANLQARGGEAASSSADGPELLVTARPIKEGGVTSQLKVTNIAPKRAATSDTAKLLVDQPGISLQAAGGISRLPVIHGLADDRLRTQVDGMDIISACGNHMNPPLSYVDPAQAESVQLFAGIVPVSEGGDSIGGAIKVKSPALLFAKAGEVIHEGEIGAFYRANGNVRGGHVSANLANDALSIRYQGATVEASNYRAGDNFKPSGSAAAGRGRLDGDEVGSSSYESTNQSIQLGLRRENQLVEFRAGVQDIPWQGFPNQRMDMTDNDSTQLNLRYEGQFDWGLVEARAYNEKTRHEMQFGEDKLYWYGPSNVAGSDGTPCIAITGGMTGCAAGMPMETEGSNTGISVQAEIDLNERDLLRLGAEAQRYRLNDWWEPSGKGMWPNTFWNINDGERDRLAAFAEWEARWNPSWLTQFGVRHEQVDMNAGVVQGYNATFNPVDEAAFNAADREKTDHNWDLTALARFTPSSTSEYEFGVSKKTRSPNLYERYAWSNHGMAMRMINWAGDGNGYVGNLELEPETAFTLSGSARWHDAASKKWELEVTPYFSYVRDYIDAARCDSDPDGNACNDANLSLTDGFVYLRFVNQDARLYGVDVSGSLELGRDESLGSLRATGVINYTRGENTETSDNLYNIMPLNAKLGLEHKLGGWTNTLEMELVSAKDEVSAVRNEVETGGYGLLSWRGSYEMKKVRFDFGVENIFDRYYEEPLGGAYLGQGKTMSGTDVPWGVVVPGPGRNIYAGVTVKF